MRVTLEQARELVSKLSPREYQIFTLMSSGVKTAAIADHLQLSMKTISNNRLMILKKLQATNTVQVAHIALAVHAVVLCDFPELGIKDDNTDRESAGDTKQG